MRGPSDIRGRVQTILDTCEAKLGNEVRSAEDITSLSNPDMAVLLIQFASGLRAKLRIAAPINSRVDASRLMEGIDSGGFPRVLIHGDGWTVSEWIEGKTIAEHGLSPEILDQAGRLLAAIHRARIEPAAGARETVLDEVRLKLQERLPVLVANEIITGAQSQRVADLARSMLAGSVDMSLIHGDFSPSNLVLRDGELYSVDNDKLRWHVTDYDACRAGTLWDEWNGSGQSLLEAYWRHSGRSVSPGSLFFWGIFDLVYRISYRVSSHGEFNRFCITRLSERLRTGSFQ